MNPVATPQTVVTARLTEPTDGRHRDASSGKRPVMVVRVFNSVSMNTVLPSRPCNHDTTPRGAE